jgi:hypothetical protein
MLLALMWAVRLACWRVDWLVDCADIFIIVYNRIEWVGLEEKQEMKYRIE